MTIVLLSLLVIMGVCIGAGVALLWVRPHHDAVWDWYCQAKDEADGWKARACLLYDIADETLRDDVLDTQRTIEAIPEVDR